MNFLEMTVRPNSLSNVSTIPPLVATWQWYRATNVTGCPVGTWQCYHATKGTRCPVGTEGAERTSRYGLVGLFANVALR